MLRAVLIRTGLIKGAVQAAQPNNEEKHSPQKDETTSDVSKDEDHDEKTQQQLFKDPAVMFVKDPEAIIKFAEQIRLNNVCLRY